MTNDKEKLYNPLDKWHLGKSVTDALLESKSQPLPIRESFIGAGIYVIYYSGAYPAYTRIAEQNKGTNPKLPIYIGKAIPRGGRKGLEGDTGRDLYDRLNEHAQSIQQVSNLKIEDFTCRYLVVDDIWIPLGESLLIQRFNPLWNVVVEGFGNHTPGKGRFEGRRPIWDTLHPGRKWAEKCKPSKKLEKEILEGIKRYFQKS